ncbi:ABC-type nitrate/sulfonate/bicarbonate transport system, permease component [Gottschalkia purinilytica]|uniref:ABC-type nitrate/sulfonate/bicarbonate transport system, permease component n=2 Tax=Gottschalkia purinilytica TaxID=1503 RepID=A0A0L0WAN4_GOTPU|nr:ABC-type nitrate/sulfonate/bicarbonate transport system, permease component [Gottschalkia purinilytica]
MEESQSKASIYNKSGTLVKSSLLNNPKIFIYKLIFFSLIIFIWYFLAKYYNNDLILPSPYNTGKSLIQSITSKEVITNILITLKRVLTGFLYAFLIGVPIGFLMGYSKIANGVVEGLIHSLRQVPLMAWVPLTIVWFGLGDGPTIFLIAFTGVFPIILNTIDGIQGISKDYYNAAKSMGAGPVSIFKDIIVPATIPNILTGCRIAISNGWMSVI